MSSPGGGITESSVSHSIFSEASHSQVVGYVVSSSNSMVICSPMPFLCCEMSSLLRLNTLQNAMMVDKDFWKSMDGDAGRSLRAENANPYPIDVSVSVWMHFCPLSGGQYNHPITSQLGNGSTD